MIGLETRRSTAAAIALGCAAMLALAIPAAAQQPSRVVRMMRGGVDGSEMVYAVRCVDGAHGSVTLRFDEERVCAVPLRGKPKCDTKWTLMEAAEHACKAVSSSR